MTSAAIDIGLPEKIQFLDHVSHIEIVRKWFGMQTLFLTAFAVFWGGFLFFWYSNIPEDGPLMVALFPLLHVAVGVLQEGLLRSPFSLTEASAHRAWRRPPSPCRSR